MKTGLSALLAIVIGSVVGLYGVLVSVFSDSALSERLTTIGIILLIYVLLSGLGGFLLQAFSWLWGFFLGIPGTVLLILYFIRESEPYYLIYMVLILGLSCLGAKGGSYLRGGRRSSK